MPGDKKSNSKHIPKFHRDKEAKKKKIINTFLKLVEHMEYSKVTTNKIAEEANLSIGTLYRYFPNGKNDIRDKAFIQNVQEFKADEIGFSKILIQRDKQETEKFVRRYLDSHKKGYEKALDRVRAASLEIFRQYEANMKDVVGQYVDLAIAEEILSKNKRSLAVHTLFLALNVVETYTHQYLFQSDTLFPSDEEFIQYVTGLFLYTLDFYLPIKKKL